MTVDDAAKGSRASKQRLGTIIETNGPLVRRIARSVHASVSGAVELEDLVQVGLAALVEASGTYVDRGEATFATFASMRVRGAMIDETRKLSTLSRRELRRRRDLQLLRRRLHSEMGRAPTNEEIAASAGMTAGQYARAVDAHQGICFGSLDDSYSDRNSSFADPAPGAYSQLETSRSADALAAAIKLLPERQQLVLQLCFVEGLTLTAIGETLGVCSARVCQIKKAALDRLRVQLGGWA
nr:sigma-70 family RNA polymerase sigma factor [Polymorphobacter multimanifer]